jgi:hypothetical protein
MRPQLGPFKQGNFFYIDMGVIMKKLAIIGCLALGLLMISSVAGNAQVGRYYAAHVPFDFTVGKKVLKAGDYTLRPASGVTNQRSLILWDSDGRGTVVGQASVGSDDSEEKGTMTFVKDGDDWALGSVDTPRFALRIKKLRTDRGEIQLAKSRSVTLQN